MVRVACRTALHPSIAVVVSACLGGHEARRSVDSSFESPDVWPQTSPPCGRGREQTDSQQQQQHQQDGTFPSPPSPPLSCTERLPTQVHCCRCRHAPPRGGACLTVRARHRTGGRAGGLADGRTLNQPTRTRRPSRSRRRGGAVVACPDRVRECGDATPSPVFLDQGNWWWLWLCVSHYVKTI